MEGEEEFQEEEVWSVLREKETPGPEMKMPKSNNNLFSASSSSSARYIPKGDEVSGVKQSSAPMNVPNWSKIYGNTKKNTSGNLHSWAIHDDDDESSMVPPHELVAKRLARTQISSFSMCEGIGRTLKGRDLSKTRNAILTKTGFWSFR
ncbi:Protein S40-5 [Cardamine amara subsp. amara]|uniref:Protein S40-5 n=1 Tax=Cardamine amara subsp. amara TaxID=228776 RepID=A0ABD1A6N1_CARAN